MSKNNKNKKILAIISALSLVVLQAIPFGVGAATTVSSFVDVTTGTVDPDKIKDDTSKKTKGPLVELTFSSTNGFKTGSEVTAVAATSDFSEETEPYYTWYLKRKGCDLSCKDGSAPKLDKNDQDDDGKNDDYVCENTDEDSNQPKEVATDNSCNFDGDKYITPNDWKIAAARIIIKRQAAGGTATGRGTEAVPSVTDDDEGWIKNFERDDNGDLEEENNKNAPDCYIQDDESGRTYELRKTEISFDTCPSGYTPSCTKTATAMCDVLNKDEWTQDNINTAEAQIITINNHFTAEEAVPESDYVYDGSLFNQEQIEEIISDNADHVGEAGYPKLLNYDDHVLPQKTITGSENVCAVGTSGDSADVFDCEINSDLDKYETSLSCEDGGAPICLQSGTTTLNDSTATGTTKPLLGKIFPELGTTNSENESRGICAQLFESNTNAAPLDSPPSFLPDQEDVWDPQNATNAGSCSYLTSALINGLKKGATVNGDYLKDALTIVEGNADLLPTCSFKKGANLCKHLFPYFPKKKVVVDGDEIDLEKSKTGDGYLTESEKKFWRTSSADSGNATNKDEALIMGLGVEEFTWLYNEEDQVGVAVEGTSYLATEHSDSSSKIMWAFSQGTCSAIEEKDSDTEGAEEGKNIRGFYTDEKSNKSILTADLDLDRCLEENLVDPTEDNDGIGEMTIDLKATPQSPTNNSTGGGDTLKVVAGVQNVDNLGSVNYKWSVEKIKAKTGYSTAPTDDTEWDDITEDIIEAEKGSLKSSDIGGLGKSTLNILLNLDDKLVDPNNEGAFYLKIKVKATEEGTSTYGYVTVKVLNEKHKFAAHSVIAGADGKLSVDSQEICADAASEGICYVSENKIVGLNILKSDDLSSVSWTVNGASMSCPSGLSSECSSGMLIFPILGNPGEVIVVTASALSSETGGTTSLTRYFIIAEPQLKIVTTNTDNVWPKLMGFYKDTDGNKTADYSSETMETNYGNTVTLKADTAAAWGYFGQSFSWTLDGEVIDTSDGYLSFDVGEETGYSYNVAVTMEEEYTEENVTKINYLRKALYKYWGVDSDSYDYGSLAASIQINVVDNTYETVSDSGKAGIFAGLITNMPQQILFLIKIFSTSFLMLFVLGLIFAVTPESLFEKEEKAVIN